MTGLEEAVARIDERTRAISALEDENMADAAEVFAQVCELLGAVKIEEPSIPLDFDYLFAETTVADVDISARSAYRSAIVSANGVRAIVSGDLDEPVVAVVGEQVEFSGYRWMGGDFARDFAVMPMSWLGYDAASIQSEIDRLKVLAEAEAAQAQVALAAAAEQSERARYEQLKAKFGETSAL